MSEEKPHFESSSPSFRFGSLAVALIAFIGLFGYAIHERNIAKRLVNENDQTATVLKETRGELGALNARLEAIEGMRQPAATPVMRHTSHARAAVVRFAKPDPRWKKVQTQLDAQGEAIDATKQDLASTRTELQGSIAKTHDELVVLQRKGERNYYEFDIDKSKQFSHTGPVGVSLRKANTKHQYADLELMVDDREVSKKHLNVYEPAMFYPDDSQQPLELVVTGITKNHIRGYISAPKYRASELTMMSGNAAPVATTAQNVGASTSPQLRRR
jgi:hypothetical protein